MGPCRDFRGSDVNGILLIIIPGVSFYSGLLIYAEIGEIDRFDLDDEERPLAINYTSGTTGRPKGVLYTHRGAYLNALGEMYVHRLERDSVYLWTLPLFHCNGWCFPWAVTGAGATHAMLRAVDPSAIFARIREEGVTHFNGAPTVLLMLSEAPEAKGVRFDPPIRVATGGAPPSPGPTSSTGRRRSVASPTRRFSRVRWITSR